jgi:hypothetical protein
MELLRFLYYTKTVTLIGYRYLSSVDKTDSGSFCASVLVYWLFGLFRFSVSLGMGARGFSTIQKPRYPLIGAVTCPSVVETQRDVQ